MRLFDPQDRGAAKRPMGGGGKEGSRKWYGRRHTPHSKKQPQYTRSFSWLSTVSSFFIELEKYKVCMIYCDASRGKKKKAPSCHLGFSFAQILASMSGSRAAVCQKKGENFCLESLSLYNL